METRDDTRRLTAEEALRESERRLSTIIGNLPGFVYRCRNEKDWPTEFVSGGVQELTGYPPEAFLSGEVDFGQLIHPEDSGRVWDEVQRALQERRRYEIEYRIIHRDGVQKWVWERGLGVYGADRNLLALEGIVEDITERRRVEETLRESQEQLRLALRSASVGLWDWDLLTNRVRFSPEYKRQIGYEDHEISDDFSEWESRVHPDDLGRATQTVREFVERPYPNYHNEFRFRHKDGSYRRILAQASLICDEQGKPIRMLGSHIDITRSRQTAEALWESEARFSAAFHTSPVALGIASLDGKFVEANRAFCELTGYSWKEIAGKTVVDLGLLSGQDRERQAAAVERSGGRVRNAELQFRVRDGSLRDLLFSTAPISLSGVPHRLAIGVDVTERKRAGEALRRTVERLNTLVDLSRSLASTLDLEALPDRLLRSLVNALPDADLGVIYLYDSKAGILVPSACLGLDAEAFRQIRLLPGESISGKVFERGQPALTRTREEAEALRGELRPENALLFSLARRNLDVQSNICAPLRTQAGEVIGTVTIGSTRAAFTEEDLALLEGVAAEAAVAIQNARLFEEVRAGQAQLEALSKRLMEAQEAERRRIARELHDEIGQVLSAVKLNLQNLPRATGVPGLASHVGESVGIVDRAIRQVRDMSLDLRPSMLDDLGLVPALRGHVRHLGARGGLRAEFEADPMEERLSPEVEIACFRVAQEALTNVMRHAQAGRVRVALRRREGELCLTVQDDGAGFDVSAARQRAAQGGSLGVLGMEERAKLAGGRLEIASAPGQGTEVRAWFPLKT